MSTSPSRFLRCTFPDHSLLSYDLEVLSSEGPHVILRGVAPEGVLAGNTVNTVNGGSGTWIAILDVVGVARDGILTTLTLRLCGAGNMRAIEQLSFGP